MREKRCKKQLVLFPIIFIFLSFLFAENGKIVSGIASFDDISSPSKNIIKLDGEWEFYWNKLYHSTYVDVNNDLIMDTLTPDSYVKVPHFWQNDIYKQTGEKTSVGCGTYRLLITHLIPLESYAILIRESPGTACKIYVNGSLIASAGIISPIPSKTVPRAQPIYAEFNATEFGNVELIIQVSNDIHRKGGLWSSVYFSQRDTLFKHYSTQTGISWLVTGTLFILALLHIILFYLTPKHKEYLSYAIFVFALSIRISIAGFSILTEFFPIINYGFQLKLEYMAIWLAPAMFMLLCLQLYPDIPVPKYAKRFLFILEFGLGFIISVLPIKYANRLIPVLNLSAVICIIAVLIFLIRTLLYRKHTVLIMFMSFIIVTIGFIAEMVFVSKKGVMPISVMPLLLLFFSIVQLLLQALQQSQAYHQQIQLIDDMTKLNEAYLRFVPKEFLQLLDKQSVTDVSPGDFIEREMTIIFSQIKFQSQNKTELTSEEQYTLFSKYLIEILPIIKKHGGFISKFISHGFMALFPHKTCDAVKCALEIIESINIKYMTQGIAIHTGKMILGTIGETNRLDDTVISDTVNTASRIESFAEKVNEKLIISQQTYDVIDSSLVDSIDLKPLGSIAVKGKAKPISLFSCSLKCECTKQEASHE